MPKAKLQVVDLGMVRPATAGDGPFLRVSPTVLATVGAGALLADLTSSGLLVRNGPTGAFTDTLDTAANFVLAYPTLAVGDQIEFIYNCNVAFAATLAVAAGITAVSAAGNLVVPASSSKLVILVKTGVATYDLYVL